MNRTRLSEAFILPAIGDIGDIGDEGVFVVSRFTHPARGEVRCPAAPLIAAWLAGQGHAAPVRAVAPRALGRSDRTAGAARSGVLAATTYLDPGGRVAGLAVAGGARRAALAEEVVRHWSRALRTRRVLVAPGPRPCRHGRHGTALLPDPRSAGSVRWPRAEDGCPKAAAAGALVRAYLDRGDTVLVLGGREERRRPERAGPGALPSGPVVEVAGVGASEALAALEGLAIRDETRLSFVVSPCAVVDEVGGLLRELRLRYPSLRGQHPDQWCYVASDARWAERAVAEASDLTLLTGEGEPALLPLPGRGSVRRIRTLGDLLPEEIAAAATVGVLATDGGSAAEGGPVAEGVPAAVTVAGLLEVLAGLGPLSVVSHRVRTDVGTGIHEDTPAAPR
ncbi:hypothetical protein ACIGZJ_28000 [Kitasatospora sp. NPDC052868]|uniref:hypothetical protein n=1 Tax=Kitasatospora sp. NPDC052868 TaxID=3364060 RepID=UPI0037C9154E